MTRRTATGQYYPYPSRRPKSSLARRAGILGLGAGVVGVGVAGAHVYAEQQAQAEQAKQAEIEQVLDPALVAAGQQITTAIENGIPMKATVNEDGTVTYEGHDEDYGAAGTYDVTILKATFGADGNLVSVYVNNGMRSNGRSHDLTTGTSAVMTAPEGHYDHELGLDDRDGGWFGAATQAGIVGHGHNVSTGRDGTTPWMGDPDPPTPAGAAAEVAEILNKELTIALEELQD